MLAGKFDISVPNVLGFYVAKAKAKEGLTSLKFQGYLPIPVLKNIPEFFSGIFRWEFE